MWSTHDFEANSLTTEAVVERVISLYRMRENQNHSADMMITV